MLNVLWSIIAAILKALVPALIEEWKKSQTPTAEDAAANPVKTTFREKVMNSRWGKSLAILLVFSTLAIAGCAAQVRTIYVQDGDPVRLAADIPDADVWVLDKDGTPVRGHVTLKEGWFCAPVERKQ